MLNYEYKPITFNDSILLDQLQEMLTKGDNYCEVFFAGLRDGKKDASSFQIESNPEKFETLNASTVREAIAKAYLQFKQSK